MARQERNNIDYFPHPVSHGKSMFYLRTKYGNDGYTAWFMILEKLGDADYHFLDLKDEIQIMYLSAEIKVDELVLKNIIQELVKMGKFDTELWNDESIVYDQKFVDSIADAYKKRNNSVINKELLLLHLSGKGRLKGPLGNRKPPKGNPKGAGNPQSKEENTKEEEIKPKGFVKPTLNQVKLYCKERGRSVNPVKWFNHYTSNGWKVGKNPMKNWKAAVHTWEESDISAPGSVPASKGSNLGGSKLPKDYGLPSKDAVPMPEEIKKRLDNLGKK